MGNTVAIFRAKVKNDGIAITPSTSVSSAAVNHVEALRDLEVFYPNERSLKSVVFGQEGFIDVPLVGFVVGKSTGVAPATKKKWMNVYFTDGTLKVPLKVWDRDFINKIDGIMEQGQYYRVQHCNLTFGYDKDGDTIKNLVLDENVTQVRLATEREKEGIRVSEADLDSAICKYIKGTLMNVFDARVFNQCVDCRIMVNEKTCSRCKESNFVKQWVATISIEVGEKCVEFSCHGRNMPNFSTGKSIEDPETLFEPFSEKMVEVEYTKGEGQLLICSALQLA